MVAAMKRSWGTIGALGLLAAWPASGHAQMIEGRAEAVDGDSLSMTGTSIRLFGIDAPEGQQTCQKDGTAWTCGEEAKQYLASLIGSKQVSCRQQDTDRYGRAVAICTAGGIDLADAMVSAGLATALPKFSDAYVGAEERARTLQLGIWGSHFLDPGEWRAANPQIRPVPLQSAPARAARSAIPAPRAYRSEHGCAIKGNRNRKGQWIYHLPGMPYYDATRPEEIFCTEAEAQAAGYRRAIVR